MASKTFVDFGLPVIDAAWLNDVNQVVYGPTSPVGTLRYALAASTGSSLVNFAQSGTGAATRSVQSKERDVLSVADFNGYYGDGSGDETLAWQNAAIEAQRLGLRTVNVPCGKHKLTGTVTATRGIVFKGEGPQGTNGNLNSIVFEPASNNLPLFLFNGNDGAGAAGTGGGIENFFLAKNNAATGCDAIKLLAIDDAHRPGEMILRNIVIAGYDSTAYNWARGLNVDGTAAATAGSKGVRSIRLEKFRVASCSTNNEYILLNQAVHVTGDHVQIDLGTGTGTCGMTVTGDSDNIILSSLILNGNLIINGSSAMNVFLGGRVGVLNVNNSLVLGTASIQSTGITNAAKNFRIASNIADTFSAYKSAATTNATGDNTAHTVVCDTEIFDKNASYDNATGIFTCKTAGLYRFTGVVAFTSLGAAHTRSDSGFLHKDSGASLIGTYSGFLNPYACGSNGGANFAQLVTADIECASGDTVVLLALVSGGTKTVSVYGNTLTGGGFSLFQGKLLA